MKNSTISKTAFLCVSLLGLSIQCFAHDVPDLTSNQQLIREAEAMVIRIDRDNVTLQDLGDKDNTIVAQFSNAEKFKAGDCHFSRAFTHLIFTPIHPGTAC